MQINGGGGIRTPVPRCFKTSVYMLSRLIVFFTLPGAKTTGSWLSYFGKVSLCRPEQPVQPACLVTPLPDPQAKSGRTGCQFRQPCATVCCRLKLVAGMISQANRRPGHAACPSTIRSKPFAPLFTFQICLLSALLNRSLWQPTLYHLLRRTTTKVYYRPDFCQKPHRRFSP